MLSAPTLRDHAVEIWKAGVAAVDSTGLVERHLRIDDDSLTIAGTTISRSEIDRVIVVGAGKAGSGMAAGVERVFAMARASDMLEGWVNVPADCVRTLERIHLHAARPAGVNEPTKAGVEGTSRILELVENAGPRDVCLVLLSGGGSALLPAPVEAIHLRDKQSVTRLLMHAGASIDELNTVRKQLSRVKGGGLARAAAGARSVVALIISDVIGDPLDIIASGPTVPDESTPEDALRILWAHTSPNTVPKFVRFYLDEPGGHHSTSPSFPENVENHVVGSNRVALEAAAERARELGYAVRSRGSENAGVAREIGLELAEECLAVRDGVETSNVCILSGGEPVVHLVSTDQPRKGGRNQELALAAVERLWDDGGHRIAILSGGTDGEDGPTDAAGGIADAGVIATAHDLGLRPAEYLAINNAYPFLERTGGLLVTGPTHTNVMDLRVALIAGE